MYIHTFMQSEHSRLGFVTSIEKTRQKITSVSYAYGSVTSLPTNAIPDLQNSSDNNADNIEDSVNVGSPVRGRGMHIDVEEENVTVTSKVNTPARKALNGNESSILTPSQVLRCYSAAHRPEGSPLR